jgi:hypothetical protein
MASAGLSAYHERIALLDVEMAKDYGVFREDYADKKTFRKAAAAAGLSWPMVQTEETRRTKGGVSTTALRNERFRLQAIAEEEQGLPMNVAAPGEKLTYTQRALNRLRLEVRASSSSAASAASPAPPKKTPVAKPAPKAAEPAAEPKAEPKAAEPAAEPKAEPKAAEPTMSPKEAAMLASLKEEYEEVKLGGIVYLQHKSLGSIFTKGEKAWELGEEMPEWDADLGEWMSA